MTVDFEALRRKLDNLKGQNKQSNALWKPTPGKHQIRIVPWKEDPSNPFIELYFHYLGRKTQLSPTTYGNADPIAEFAEEVRGDGSRENWEMAKKFFPKLRTYVPIVVRGEEDAGVRFWGFGKTVFQELLAVFADEEYGDITDPVSGADIKLTYIDKENSDTNFAKTNIHMARAVSALSDDAELVQKWLTEQPDIKEVFKEPTYDELADFLRRHIDPDADSSVTSEELSVPTPPTPPPAEAAVEDDDDDDEAGVESSDVADEFDALFND